MKKLTFILFILLVIQIGCSGNRLPSIPNESVKYPIDNLPVGISDWNSYGEPIAGQGLLGIFNFHVDTEKISAELTPLRTTNLTDVLESIDITNFLTLAPCFDCVKIKSVSKDINGNIVLSIGIRHPFQAGDPLKPITGRNRADLHVFNVEGIIVSATTGKTFPQLSETIADFMLLNADGYTSYLDDALDNIYPTAATIHPYITHFDDYSSGNFNAANPMGFASVTIPPPSGNLVMAMGCDYDFQDYIFQINNSINFIYVVGCTYAVSAANKSERFSPQYRIPQHNKKAASEISVEILSNNLKAGDNTSTAQLAIKVVDINHGVEIGNALNQMLHDSSVNKISVYVPGITSSFISIDGSSSISGSGHSPSDPLIYHLTITNSASGEQGEYYGLVKVLDNYPVGSNTSPLLNKMDGIKRVSPIENPLIGLFPISEFASFQTFKISILNVNQPPVAVASIASSVYASGSASITLDATSSYDPDGIIVNYEWDFNNDGTFNGIGDEYTGQPWNPIHSFQLGVCIDVQLRVTDDRNESDTLDVPLKVCPFKNLVLRLGVNISDIATIEDTNEVLVMFEDHQVWKYSADFSSGSLFYTMPGYPKTAQRIEASSNGDSCCGWWNDYQWHWYSYYANGALAAEHTYPWPSYPADPPYNFDLAVSYCPNSWVIPGTHHLLGNFFKPYTNPAWVRAGYTPTAYTNWTSNYNDIHNGPGPGKIQISYVKGMHARKSTDQNRTFYVLEGEPEWRVEFMSILAWVYTGWGGTQTDSDSGFYNPQDITCDANDKVFVLDILSSGIPKIKRFSYLGTSEGSFGNSVTMASPPKRLDASFATNWIYVSMDDKVSIFFPVEQP